MAVSPPPGPTKTENALKFGILGAAKIAPMALIIPASQHAEVIVQAVAARNKDKATAFAKKHNIPQVFDSYQALLDDPSIDAVFIPLPNGLHFEWALKALAAGKHVLLEKPSVSNATEAELLFHSPLLQKPDAPVILEAFHYRFYPSWLLFLSFIDPANIEHVDVKMPIEPSYYDKDDIRYHYELGGGGLMDLSYTMSILRGVFQAEPVECTSIETKTRPPPQELIDEQFRATWRFPNGGTADMYGNINDSLWNLLAERYPVTVKHRPVVVPDPTLPEDQEKVRTRTAKLLNFLFPGIWHRLDIEDHYVIRRKSDGEPLKNWTEWQTKKAYTYQDADIPGKQSENHWLTYGYQLDAFVDKIRGRDGTGQWVSGEDSIAQMKMVDMAYTKAGLPLRPTSTFRLKTTD